MFLPAFNGTLHGNYNIQQLYGSLLLLLLSSMREMIGVEKL